MSYNHTGSVMMDGCTFLRLLKSHAPFTLVIKLGSGLIQLSIVFG